MRVLVTGGAGFIGSHVVDRLVAAGHEVVVLDRLHEAAHAGPPDYLNPDADYHTVDLRDTAAVTEIVAGARAVSHQAAMVGLGEDFGEVTDYVGDNDLGTASLLRALHDTGDCRRLVLGGSMVVYGEGRYRCGDCGLVRPAPRRDADLREGRYEPRCPRCDGQLSPEAVPETARTDPRSVYAATKLAQEHLCGAFAGQHDATSLTVLRYHNVYGPRMPRDTPYAGVASIFRSALAAGRRPQVFEDGGQLRDFVHVRDVARANVRALTAEEPATGAFNVASGSPRSVLQMARALAATFDGELAPEVVGGWRPGDVRHVFAATDRAREQLGFTASVGFEEGMAAFAEAPLRAPPG